MWNLIYPLPSHSLLKQWLNTSKPKHHWRPCVSINNLKFVTSLDYFYVYTFFKNMYFCSQKLRFEHYFVYCKMTMASLKQFIICSNFEWNRRVCVTSLWKGTFGQNWPKTVRASRRHDEVQAKREPSLCNESVKRHFWSNPCLNCNRTEKCQSTKVALLHTHGFYCFFLVSTAIQQKNGNSLK